MTAERSRSTKPLARGTYAWITVVEAYNLCIAQLAARLAEVNVPIAEHEILMNVAKHPGASQQQVAKNCFVAKSGVSMLLAKLEREGLIERCPDANDSRVRKVFLTPKGKKLAEKTARIQQDIVALMADPISDVDLKRLATLMEGVSKRLRS
jgi:DNA-binding MarR family transcriptional regulator